MLGADFMPPLLIENHPRQLIDASHRFAKKRYDHEYRWTPAKEVVAAIGKAIFGQG